MAIHRRELYRIELKNQIGGPGAAPGRAGARNERHPVNGANGEASEQIKCASRSAMRERRSGFDIANCGKRGVHGTTPPNRLRRAAAKECAYGAAVPRRSREENELTAAGRPAKERAYGAAVIVAKIS